MSRERTKILKMVAEGKISPEDGERLLSRIEKSPNAVAVLDGNVHRGEPSDNGKAPLKFLRIVVDGGEDTINVRVPIALIRTGIRLTTLLPLSASEHLTEHGIDLSQFNDLDGEELIEALRELRVDVDGGDGTIIRVFCE